MDKCKCRMAEDITGVSLWYCPLHAVAPALLEALEDVVETHDGRCDSCGCEIAPEGYCGCAIGRDEVMHERRCKARAAIRAAKGEAQS